MTNQILLFTGAVLVVLWGIAHLFPTRSVINGFGEISVDNRRIILMEWVIEGAALIFIGAVVACTTYIDSTHQVSYVMYWLSFIMLNSLSLISLFTGFKVDFIPFKLCPVIFTGSSILILLGIYV
jgi:hypothetical protein